MPQPFTVFPRESVLFGVALGEYLRLHELGHERSFEGALYRRVHPFVPDQTRIIEREVDASEIPDGVTWIGQNAGDTEVAMGDIIEPLLRRRGGKPFRIEYDRSRRSALDLLIEYLTDDRQLFNDDAAVRERLHLVPPLARSEKTPAEISRLMDLLIVHNDLSKTFTVGKLLGRTFGDCVATESYLIYMEESFIDLDPELRTVSDEDFQGLSSIVKPGAQLNELGLRRELEISWGRLLDQLTRDPVFRNCFHDDTAFNNREAFRGPKYIHGGRYFGFSHLEDTYGSALNAMLSVRGNLCLILGSILGMLQDQEREARELDAKRPTPRAFSLPSGASMERIGGQLYLAERALNEGETLPEDIIRMLGSAIEGFSRKLWPSVTNDKVSEVLREKKHRGTDLEKRFACMAFDVYVGYRNKAEHEPSTFRCHAYEARYFVVTIRTLYELVKQIEKQRATGKT